MNARFLPAALLSLITASLLISCGEAAVSKDYKIMLEQFSGYTKQTLTKIETTSSFEEMHAIAADYLASAKARRAAFNEKHPAWANRDLAILTSDNPDTFTAFKTEADTINDIYADLTVKAADYDQHLADELTLDISHIGDAFRAVLH